MYKIQKKFTIPIGHRLSYHKGKCANWHGHNFEIIVGLKSETLNSNGMILDFADLKTIVHLVIDKWDHALLLHEDDYKKIIEDADIEGVFKTMFNLHSFPFDPTAENLSRVIFEEIKVHLDRSYPLIDLDFVEIWENINSMAKYSMD